MKTTTILLLAATSLCFTSVTLGQGALNETEIQGILQQLTSRSRNTWISAGTIQATHYEEGGPHVTDPAVIQAETEKAIREYQQAVSENPLPATVQENPQKLELDAIPFNVRYDLANEYTMTTRETVKYDGQRFHWEITLTGRSDSIPLDPALQGNYMVQHFKEHELWNRHRIFAWDGQEYTTYSVSGGQAIVDAAGRMPRAVNGPLTAGLIPWGYAKFSGANLSADDVSAGTISSNGTPSIQMTISHTDGSSTELVLDSSKDYAVTSATLTGKSGIVVTYTCSGYQQAAGQWVPTSVAIERRNVGVRSRAPTMELWTGIQVTSTSAPSPSSFDASIALDATVEYGSPATASPVLYINSYEADTNKLLTERLVYGAAQNTRPQNCATAALQHVAADFGKSVSWGALASLVGPDGRTSLLDLKQSVQRLGLYGNVVKTDLAGLRDLGAAKAILHLPGKNHFVIVDHVDDRYIWLIDLSGKRFYYRESVYLFPMAWPAGTALLVSDRSIPSRFAELPDAAAKEITGGYWLCNTLYQEYDQTGCDWIPDVWCGGYVTVYWERWICGVVETGTCPVQTLVQRQKSPCVPDPINDCVITGTWQYYYMRACQ